MNNIKTVSILGCGWLGLPLASNLILYDFSIKGSTTRPEKLTLLEKAGIQPFLIDFTPEISANDDSGFWNSEVLVITIPPLRRSDIESYYPKQFKAIIPKIIEGEIKKVLFTSSTSVYPSANATVKENDAVNPEKSSGKALIEVENLLMNEKTFQTTILRFGGLIGYDRNPGRFLAGRKDLKNGNAPVNLIHRDDCIHIMETIIESEKHWGKIYNAVCDEHPTRKAYYTAAAKAMNLPVPEFDTINTSNYKIVSADKLKSDLAYSFIHPDPEKMFIE